MHILGYICRCLKLSSLLLSFPNIPSNLPSLGLRSHIHNMQVSEGILAAMPKHTTCKALLEDVVPRLMPIEKLEPWTEWAVSVRWLDGPYYDREDQNRTYTRRYKGE